MYSIQLQMPEQEKSQCDMRTCPHPAQNVCQTLNCYFWKLTFVHDLVLKNINK